MICQLRKLGNDSLVNISNESKVSSGFRILGRVLRSLERMARSDSAVCRSSIDLSSKLFKFFQEWKIQSRSKGNDSKMYLLIDFVIDESTCPEDVCLALILWSSSNDCGEMLLPRLRSLLRKGVHYSEGELSGTLLRLRQARSTFTELVDGERSNVKDGVWEAMSAGTLTIDK